MGHNTFVEEIPLDEWLALLKTQVTLFADKEIDIVQQRGLHCTSRSVLDVGCGAGFFVERLQQRFPLGQFIAVDQNQALIDAFRTRCAGTASAANTTIAVWQVGVQPCPVQAMSQVEAVIVRLVLQHVTEPVSFLRHLRDHLSVGTKIYVIEEDDDFFKCDPPLPAFQRVIRGWAEYGVAHHNHRRLGAMVPRLLAEAGFTVRSVDLVSHSHQEVGLDQLLGYFATTAAMIHKTSPSIISAEDLQQIKHDFQNLTPQQAARMFLCYPQVITVAECA